MAIISSLADYFNIKRFKLWQHNLLYNKKMLFSIYKTNGYLLEKKIYRKQLINANQQVIKELIEKNRWLKYKLWLHNIKIVRKNKIDDIKYLNTYNILIEFLKFYNKNLYITLEKNWFIDTVKNLIKKIYSNPIVNYYMAISRWNQNPNYNIYTDYYFLKDLNNKIEQNLLEWLLDTVKSEYNIIDQIDEILWIYDNFYNLDEVDYINNFYWLYSEKLLNKKEIKLLLSKIDKEIGYYLMEEFNNFLLEKEIYKYNKSFKYKNKILYHIITLIEKIKTKYFTTENITNASVPIVVKEWIDFFKINDVIYKTFYVVPIETEFTAKNKDYNPEDIFYFLRFLPHNFDFIAWYSFYPTNTSPLWSQIKEEYASYWIFNSIFSFTIISSDLGIFKVVKEELEGFVKNKWYMIKEHKNISDLFPYYKNEGFAVDTYGILLTGNQKFLENNADFCLNQFYPKNVFIEKGLLLGYNKENLNPAFLVLGDKDITTSMNTIITWFTGSWKTATTMWLITNSSIFNRFVIIDHMWNYNKLVEKLWWKVISFKDEEINFLITPTNYDINIYTEWILQIFIKIFNLDNDQKAILSKIIKQIYNNKKYIKNNKYFVKFKDIINELVIEYNQIINDNNVSVTYKNIFYNLIQRLKNEESRFKILNSDKSFDLLDDFYKYNIVLLDTSYLINKWWIWKNIFFFLILNNLILYLYDLDYRKKIIQKAIDKNIFTEKFVKDNIHWKIAMPVFLVIEEAHNYIDDEITGSLFRKIVKEIRNKAGGVWAITQELSDFLKNEYGKSLFTQSWNYILLLANLKPDDKDLLIKTLSTKEDVYIDKEELDKLLKADNIWTAVVINWRLLPYKVNIVIPQNILDFLK